VCDFVAFLFLSFSFLLSFQVARMPDETSANLEEIGKHVRGLLEHFAVSTGRKLHLEIEPGTFLTAGCGVLLSRVIDITDTGKVWFRRNSERWLKVISIFLPEKKRMVTRLFVWTLG
jgi:hypothetical protein